MKKSQNQWSTIFLLSLIITVLTIFGPYRAGAAPQPLPFDFPVPELGMLYWEEIELENFCFGDDVPGLNISDAIDALGTSDAYDNAWNTSINGTPFAPMAVGDLTNRTYTSAPQNLSGLDVTYQLFFSQNTQCNRLVLFLDNNTGGPINETVRIDTDFGSDDNTTVEGTSSGDLNFTTQDRWLVTSDEFPFSDPVLTNVFYGPGNPLSPTISASLDHCPGTGFEDDGFAVEFNVTVPQGESRCLMLFGCLADITGLGNTVEGALSAAQLFNSNDTIPGDLLSGLTQQDLANCVNWDFTPREIPTLSEWGLFAMAAILGIVGFMVIRRKKATV